MNGSGASALLAWSRTACLNRLVQFHSARRPHMCECVKKTCTDHNLGQCGGTGRALGSALCESGYRTLVSGRNTRASVPQGSETRVPSVSSFV
jgi:hypothetical protein